MKNNIKLFIAVLLLLCLAPMPYGYYVLVRFLAMVVFGVMAYQYYQEKREWLMWIFATLALLFQPFAKIALGRLMWNIVDVVVAVGLIILYVIEMKKPKKGQEEKNAVGPTVISPLKNEPVKREYEFHLEGKLSPKELVYIANEEDYVLKDIFENRPEFFEGWGTMIGFHIIYLPLLIKRLQNKQVMQYRAPYLKETELKIKSIGNDLLLKYLVHPADKEQLKHGFIRTEDIRRKDGKDVAINTFYPLDSNSQEPLADQLNRIGKEIVRSEGRLLSADEWGPASGDADDFFNSQLGEEDISDLMDEVRERIQKLRQRGIAEYLLEQLIHPDDRLSRLVITKDYRILLPDYNDMEIKMEPLVKAVYLLFLNHPEGIVFKHLPDYRKELLDIYRKLRPMGLTERTILSIEDVTNPLLNSINEKCARIRGAFLSQFDDRMARHYYIDGRRGEPKKIDIDRSLVIWE